ncbi:MAG: DUF4031 domain-containing protein [Asticcacaulis sp.]|uniref:DUF4031 domain-containing protein n=1 Tax=Asticcacaulis sp. TaxID=1872648 RepID=UPI003F7CB7CF
MTVYVDDMYRYPMGRFRRMKMSHMIADSREELDAMADKIGVARRWIQNAGTHQEHYDIAMTARVKAVQSGAIEISLRDCSFMCVRRHVEGILGLPAEAEMWRLAHWAKMQAQKGGAA